jgi:hypothetical protein
LNLFGLALFLTVELQGVCEADGAGISSLSSVAGEHAGVQLSLHQRCVG